MVSEVSEEEIFGEGTDSGKGIYEGVSDHAENGSSMLGNNVKKTISEISTSKYFIVVIFSITILFFLSLVLFFAVMVLSGGSNKGSSLFLDDTVDSVFRLISDGDHYECYGSCFCSSDDERMSSAAINSKKAMIYLITAVTSFIAYQKAQDFFQKECQARMISENNCFPSDIQSEVTECLPSKKKDKSEEENNGIRKFLCKGNCLSNKRLKVYHTIQEALDFGCENLKREEVILLDTSELVSVGFNDRARAAFASSVLKDFCKEESSSSYRRKSPSGQRHYIRFSRCVGMRNRGVNPSVHCIQIEPVATMGNPRKYWGEKRY